MEALFWLVTFLAVAGVAACRRLALPLWSAAVAAWLLLWTWLYQPGALAAVPAWLLFVLAALPLNVTVLRRRLSARVLAAFRTMMPRMSRTEREALEAGTVWWDGELFGGRPDWQRLLALPAPRLTPEEQAFLDGPVDELCRMLDDWQITEELHDLPEEVWRYIKEQGFFGMIIPREYGGLGFSALAHSCVVQKIATRSTTAAVTVMVPNSLGPAELLLHYGTEEQKRHYLPRLARGEEVPCFALTGPEAGSDAGAMPDRGVVCRGEFRGEEIVGIRLNWEKRYITLGPVATVLGLAFKLYDPDHLLGGEEDLGITLALIPTDTPGITIGTRHAPLNQVFQNGPNWGRDVFIPLDWIIGGAERAGQGWRMLMESLAAGRSISLPALSTGAAKLASRATGAYARIRRQFKVPIGRFEGVEAALARIAGSAYLMEAARAMTAGAVDSGAKPSVISAIVKYHLTEHMRGVINDAMDVQGGSAICMGPRNLLGRIYQAIPISITVEGANILTRSLIIFGQGAVRCHPYVLKEMQAVACADREKALRDFDTAFWGHVGFTVSNVVRSLWLGLGGARLLRPPGAPQCRRYYQDLTRLSAVFAMNADIAMLLLGGALKRRERLSARLGDVLSHLYLASAVLKRFEDDGRPEADLPLVHWSCQRSLHLAQEALSDFLRNLPLRPVAWVLRLLAFPLGRPWRAPGDALEHQVAGLILAPSPSRDRLTAGIYLTDDEQQPLGRLDRTLELVMACTPIEERLHQALRDGRISNEGGEEALLEQALAAGLLDEEEAARYRRLIAMRREVIRVDDFPADYWKR
ncbi:MAG TPA: acyl-CoA dehydrogenase [Gammaproteobacteria bacterium]|nr:acyl-CoA dehydrogenase [Gammaproteobacteria bacterium]